VSLIVDFAGAEGTQLGDLLAMDEGGARPGELWRLWTVTLVHAPLTVMPFHLLFNMYALWLAGPIVEQMYGRWRFLLFYLAFAAGGSLLTFAFGDARFGVGASGAIFGLFGVLFAAQRIHQPGVDRGTRAFLGQLGGLLAINLLFGFIVSGIDNSPHRRPVRRAGLGFYRAHQRADAARSLWVRQGSGSGTTVPAFGPAARRSSGWRHPGAPGLFAALFALGARPGLACSRCPRRLAPGSRARGLDSTRSSGGSRRQRVLTDSWPPRPAGRRVLADQRTRGWWIVPRQVTEGLGAVAGLATTVAASLPETVGVPRSRPVASRVAFGVRWRRTAPCSMPGGRPPR